MAQNLSEEGGKTWERRGREAEGGQEEYELEEERRSKKWQGGNEELEEDGGVGSEDENRSLRKRGTRGWRRRTCTPLASSSGANISRGADFILSGKIFTVGTPSLS